MNTLAVIVVVALLCFAIVGTAVLYEGKMVRRYEEYERACENAYDEGFEDAVKQRKCDQALKRGRRRKLGDQVTPI